MMWWCDPIMSPMPIKPMVRRLFGAFWPNTVEGTRVGSASAAPERAALFRNSRRVKGWLFMTIVRARMADGPTACQTIKYSMFGVSPCACGELPEPVRHPVLPPSWRHGTAGVLVPCASLVHPLCIWTNNVNARFLAAAVSAAFLRRGQIREGDTNTQIYSVPLPPV